MMINASTVWPVEWDKSDRILSSVACNLDQDILLTLMPLFAKGEIEGLEWSFDTLYQRKQIPDWFFDLLEVYGSNSSLVGHGVLFSILSGLWREEQQMWLKHLSEMSNRFNFDHVTEHFGFTTGSNFHKGAPLGVPLTESTLQIGRDRICRIQDAAQCPVGLENLAFAYHQDEVKKQGEFIHQLIEPVNGFIILDLHNIYCQSHNFNIKAEELIHFYPLDRVREIHISGGSWEPSRVNDHKIIRRDTHDDSVPIEVFELLKSTLPLCTNLKYVVLEQIGVALKQEDQRRQFRLDFQAMNRIVKDSRPKVKSKQNFLPEKYFNLQEPITDLNLYHEQLAISNILESSKDLSEAKLKLAKSKLVDTEWEIEKWNDDMLDTAILIAQKWKNGF